MIQDIYERINSLYDGLDGCRSIQERLQDSFPNIKLNESSLPIKSSELIRETDKYEIRKELIDAKEYGIPEDAEMTSAYSKKDGSYIGDEKTAKMLCDDRGVLPEKSADSHNVASIGKSDKDDKWYGWSHRAIYGFSIGETCKEGDCGYTPQKGEWEAKTEEDAKQMAIDFAKGVS